MTRDITIKALSALLNGKNGKFGGVSKYDGRVNTTVKDNILYLHDNAIIKIVNDTLFVRIHTNSVTTRERLNGLNKFGYNISLVQRKRIPILNGEKVEDLYKWYKIDKI